MQKTIFTKSSLLALMALAITACGSGGRDSNQPSTNVPTANQPSSTTNTQKGEVTNGNRTGGAFVISGDRDNASFTTHTENINNANADVIVVDGVTILVRRPNIKVGGWAHTKSGDTESYVCCGKYTDSYIGAYEGDPTDKFVLYYNGNPTDLNQIPQSGTATYLGDAIYTTSRYEDDLDDDFVRGSSKFTADFNAKTLTGELTFNNTNVAIDSKINGNNFTGIATSNSDVDVAKVEGKFYGVNAKELAGMAVADENLKVKEQGWVAGFVAGKVE